MSGNGGGASWVPGEQGEAEEEKMNGLKVNKKGRKPMGGWDTEIKKERKKKEKERERQQASKIAGGKQLLSSRDYVFD